VAGGWEELVDTARDLGVTVPPTSRPGQAAALAVTPVVAREADVATFSPDEGASARDFWAEVERARTRLRTGASLPRRLLAPFDPRSLLRR
jgi:hypothetical protein